MICDEPAPSDFMIAIESSRCCRCARIAIATPTAPSTSATSDISDSSPVAPSSARVIDGIRLAIVADLRLRQNRLQLCCADSATCASDAGCPDAVGCSLNSKRRVARVPGASRPSARQRMLRDQDARTRCEGPGQPVRFIRHNRSNAKGAVAQLDRIPNLQMKTQQQIVANRNASNPSAPRAIGIAGSSTTSP